jgi:hypothetical protein
VGSEQRLAQPTAVVRDQRVGSSEDMRRGAVILFQPDHLGAGKIRFEPQDIGDFGAAPAVDRLIIIADTTNVGILFVLDYFRLLKCPSAILRSFLRKAYF